MKKNTAILGVSLDTPEENAAFAAKFGFPYPLLCDTGRTMAMAYGAVDSPAGEYANRIGVVIGPDGRIKQWHAKVSAKDWPAQLLTEI